MKDSSYMSFLTDPEIPDYSVWMMKDGTRVQVMPWEYIPSADYQYIRFRPSGTGKNPFWISVRQCEYFNFKACLAYRIGG